MIPDFRSYYGYTSKDLAKLILSDSFQSDTAAFCLVRYKMEGMFTSLYLQYHLDDDLGDVMMDFFLYLRGENDRPYEMLRQIRNLDNMESWLSQTFRHFLVRKQNAQDKKMRMEGVVSDDETPVSGLLDERISCVAKLMAWVDGKLSDSDRFIFYRSLLSELDCSMVKNDMMAEALGFTYTNYRTRDSRIRSKVMKKFEAIRNREQQEDMEGLVDSTLYNRVTEDYENFTSIVQELYTDILDRLNAKEKVESLRKGKGENEDAGIQWALASDDDKHGLQWSLGGVSKREEYNETRLDTLCSLFDELNKRSKLYEEFVFFLKKED